jgi:hypothetical protein
MARLVKKLSAKQIVQVDIKKFAEKLKKNGARMKLYAITGQASGIKTGSNTNGDGEWVAFTGDFEARPLVGHHETGEVLEDCIGNKAFITEPFQALIYEQLKESDTVEFALVVSIIKDESSVVGYVYDTQSLIDIKPSDTLSKLRTLLPPAVKMLKNKVKAKAA